MSLRSWVCEVKGKATAIDHLKGEITVDRQFRVPYDILVLATGEQYQVGHVRVGGESLTVTKRASNIFHLETD